MNNDKQSLSISEIKEIDIVSWLSKMGCNPVKIRNNDYWYLSPLHIEKTASFKVNRKINKWYDHGLGKGGSLIDFGMLYHQCTMSDLLINISLIFLFKGCHQLIFKTLIRKVKSQ